MANHISFVKAATMTQYRTVAQVVTTYKDQLTNFTYEALNGSMDAVDLQRAHREMIRRLGPSAYVEGLREGGVPAEELDATDKAAIADWIKGQSAHVNKFASDTVAARGDDGKRAQILGRVDLWVNSMQTIGSQGLMSAQKNRMGTWRLGATEEHCTTKNGRVGCANLHGKRHRLSWFLSRGLVPQEPGSAILGCQGYKCLCEIKGDDGTTLVPSMRAVRFDPAQPRDEQGQWTDTGKGAGSGSSIPKVYHLTTEENANKIIEGGFKASVSGEIGPGVYLTSNPNKLTDPRFKNAVQLKVEIKPGVKLLEAQDRPNKIMSVLVALYGDRAGAVYDSMKQSEKFDESGNINWKHIHSIVKKSGYGGIILSGHVSDKNIVIFNPKDLKATRA